MIVWFAVCETVTPEMTSKSVTGGMGGDLKGLKQNRIEDCITLRPTRERRAVRRVSRRWRGVHGPPAHSGLGNICSGVAKD